MVLNRRGEVSQGTEELDSGKRFGMVATDEQERHLPPAVARLEDVDLILEAIPQQPGVHAQSGEPARTGRVPTQPRQTPSAPGTAPGDQPAAAGPIRERQARGPVP